MIRVPLFLISAFFSVSNSFADCSFDKSVVGATYKVTTTDKESGRQATHHISLWRNGNRVAHEYPEKEMTEVWEKMQNDKLRMVHYFDHHKRGIEYEPDEIKIRHTDSDWELKYQLVSNDLIRAMQLQSTQGTGCDKKENYTLTKGNRTLSLEWLAQQKLVSNFHEQTARKSVQWTLEGVVKDPKKVATIFNQRSRFLTTDYADVGDNESDPFLMKMINLGHISHGASGFYNEHGELLKGNHQGHQH